MRWVLPEAASCRNSTTKAFVESRKVRQRGILFRLCENIRHRIGNFIFRHGEHFYNFEGLRRYKAKFHPTWEPKYLVAPGGVGLPLILLDVSVLIAGGIKELFVK